GGLATRIEAKERRKEPDMTALPNIVLVHGAWADGSSWSAVIEHLQADGYRVTAPQFPESSLAADVARLCGVLARQNGPTVVAGHSYGGQIITALGTDTPNVVGLVYIAAFGLDEGESIGALLGQGPLGPPRGRLRQPLRGRGRPGQGQGHVRGPAAVALERPRGDDGRPGLAVAAVLVPGRRRRPSDPARCPAAVRGSHGRYHRGGLDQPRGHGFPS
ncbi:MAG TPA: alpha/beta fold hydrolase, partial [Propionibacteriaceae bacterium]|nr:alpha/beta fold hydrolase [Propionibacteriaceae bacterium]